jgi:hypothetical protein
MSFTRFGLAAFYQTIEESTDTIKPEPIVIEDGIYDLTSDMFKKWASHDAAEGEDLGCSVAMNQSTSMVYGDSNVGGIAGGISLNSEMNGENLLDSSSNSLIKNRYSLHATIQSCVNRGEVTARHECVGGIVGRMDFGLVLHCETFSDVQIEEGDYAGGICGLSYGRISSCCVKASLSGKRYVGGILGNGYVGGS